jgi:hypothetical protein
MYVRDKGWKGVERMHLAQDRDQLRALLITVMNLQVLQQAESPRQMSNC